MAKKQKGTSEVKDDAAVSQYMGDTSETGITLTSNKEKTKGIKNG